MTAKQRTLRLQINKRLTGNTDITLYVEHNHQIYRQTRLIIQPSTHESETEQCLLHLEEMVRYILMDIKHTKVPEDAS